MTYYDEVATDAPRLWHKFDANSVDNAGAASMGAVTIGGSGAIYGDTRFGRGIKMVDETSYAQYNLPEDVFNGQWTIETWFKVQATKEYNNILRISPSNGKHIGLRVRGSIHASQYRPNTIELFTYDGISWGDVTTPTTVNINDNQWHHVVVKAEGTGTTKNLVMFVDGVKYTTGTASTRAISGMTGGPMKIGAGPDPGGVEAFRDGFIDDIAIYNKALSDARITAHYDARLITGVTVDVATATASLSAPTGSWDSRVDVDTPNASTQAQSAIVEGYGQNTISSTVSPIYDAEVSLDGTLPNSIKNNMRVEGGTSTKRKTAQLQFSKSALFGANPVSLTQATLSVEVYARNTAPAFTITANGVTESTISTYPEPAPNSVMEIDVTSIVESTTGDTITINLVGNGATDSYYVSFKSSETTLASEWPELKALYEPMNEHVNAPVDTATASLTTQDPTVEAIVHFAEVVDLTTAAVSTRAYDAGFEEIRTVVLNPTSDRHRLQATETWVNNTDYLALNYDPAVAPTQILVPIGTEAEKALVYAAMERMDYPFEQLAGLLNYYYGRNYIPVYIRDVEDTEDGIILGRWRAMSGEIDIDIRQTQPGKFDALVNTLSHELAHAIDFLLFDNYLRTRVWNIIHPSNPLPDGTVIADGVEVANGEGWTGYGAYNTFVGEAYAELFGMAYTSTENVNYNNVHVLTDVMADQLRYLLTPELPITRGPFPYRTPAIHMDFAELPASAIVGNVLDVNLRLNVELNGSGGEFDIQTLKSGGRHTLTSENYRTQLPLGINNIDLTSIFQSDNFESLRINNVKAGAVQGIRISSVDDGVSTTMPELTIRYVVAQGSLLNDVDTATSTMNPVEPTEVSTTTSPHMVAFFDTAQISTVAVDATPAINVGVDVSNTDPLTLASDGAYVDIRVPAVVVVDSPTVRFSQPKLTDVNGEPVLPDDTDDPYFVSTLRTLSGWSLPISGGNNTGGTSLDQSFAEWFRFNEETGNKAWDNAYDINESNRDTLYLDNVVVGRHDGPDGRHNFHFNGDAYAKQNEGGGDYYYRPSGVEFTFRTDRKTQFIMGGADIEGGRLWDTEVPPWELWMVDGFLELRHYDWNLNYTVSAKGRTNLADGKWHHIVVQKSHEGSQDGNAQDISFAVEFYVDAKLEVRRRTGDSVQGFPDFIGGRPENWYPNARMVMGAAPLGKSHWFKGDMTEVVYRNGRVLNDDEIAIQRDNVMGILPVRPEVARVAVEAEEATAKGNKPRVLVLHFTPHRSNVAERGTTFPLTQQARLAYKGAKGGEVALAALENGLTTEFLGYGYDGSSSHAYLNFHYNVWDYWSPADNQRVTYKDPITDNHRLIDLEVDLNMDDFDIISITGYPANDWDWSLFNGLDEKNFEPKVPMRKQLEDLMVQIRDQVTYNRKSLLVTDPFSAIALGIVNKVEFVPNVIEQAFLDARLGAEVGIYDWRSAQVDPFYGAKPDIPPEYRTEVTEDKASRYDDTHANIKQVVRTIVPGLTTQPGWVKSEELRWWNVNPFGDPPFAFSRHFEDRPFGLGLYDEFFLEAAHWENDQWLMPGSHQNAERSNGFVASRSNNILAGVAVTTFSPLYWSGNADGWKGNPYFDHAVSIAIQPGDVWAGKQVNGKVYVNFTEAYSQWADSEKTDYIMAWTDRGWSPEDSIAVGGVISFRDGGSWTIGPEHRYWQFSTHFGSQIGSEVTLPAPVRDRDWGWSAGGVRGGSGGGLGAGTAMQWRWRSFGELEEIKTPTMANRGLKWLAQDLDISGNANVDVKTAESSSVAYEVEVEAVKSVEVSVSTARTQMDAHNDMNTVSPDVSMLVGSAAVTVQAVPEKIVIDLSTARTSLNTNDPDAADFRLDWAEALVLTLPRQALTLTLEDN